MTETGFPDRALGSRSASTTNHRGIAFVAAVAVVMFSQPLVFMQNRMVHITIPLAVIAVLVALKAGSPLGKIRISPLIILLVLLSALSLFWTVSTRSTLLELLVLISVVVVGSLVGSFCSMESICRAIAWAGFAILLASISIAILTPSYGLQSGDYQGGSLRGIYSHRNILAFTLVVSLMAAIIMRTRKKATKLFLVLALSAGIVSTNSSTAIVCSIVIFLTYIVLVFFAAFRRGYRLVPAIVVAPFGVLGIVGVLNYWDKILLLLGRDSTFTGRSYIWAAVAQVSQNEPLLGYGWGGVWSGSPIQAHISGLTGFRVPHAHSGYLDIRVQLGYLGLSIFIALLALLMVHGLRAFLATGKRVFAITPVVVAVFTLYNCFETRITLPLSLFILVVLSSRLLAEAGQRREGGEEFEG